MNRTLTARLVFLSNISTRYKKNALLAEWIQTHTVKHQNVLVSLLRKVEVIPVKGAQPMVFEQNVQQVHTGGMVRRPQRYSVNI